MRSVLGLIVISAALLASTASQAEDWSIVYPGGYYECAKSKVGCDMFVAAVRRGWIVDVTPTTTLRCVPYPGCFSARSNCIVGYNCR